METSKVGGRTTLVPKQDSHSAAHRNRLLVLLRNFSFILFGPVRFRLLLTRTAHARTERVAHAQCEREGKDSKCLSRSYLRRLCEHAQCEKDTFEISPVRKGQKENCAAAQGVGPDGPQSENPTPKPKSFHSSKKAEDTSPYSSLLASSLTRILVR